MSFPIDLPRVNVAAFQWCHPRGNHGQECEIEAYSVRERAAKCKSSIRDDGSFTVEFIRRNGKHICLLFRPYP